MEPDTTTPTEQDLLYTIEPIAPRDLQVKPNRNKWNLGHQTAEGIANNPITVSDDNTTFTAVATLKHPALPDQTYYLEDRNTPHGWKVSDCKPASKGDNIYVVLKGGEFTHDIARKNNIDEGELCEHNELTPGKVKAGTELHLPYPIDTKPENNIEYTIFDEVETYHVVKPEGARQYGFGNADQPKKIIAVGPTSVHNKNVRIKGKAILQFGEAKYGYYLTETVIEPATGRVVKPIGYPFEFLQKGESLIKPNKNPTMGDIEASLAAVEAFTQEPDPNDYLDMDAPAAPVTDPQKPTSWRDSYVAYPEPQYMRTIIAQDVFDLSGTKPLKQHFYGKVWIAGEFQRVDYDTKELITYGRPWASAENVKKNPNWRPDWYGINRDNLEPVMDDDDAYEPVDDARAGQDYEITMPTGTRTNYFKGEELFRQVVAKPLVQSVRIMDMAKKQIKRKII